jgi:hypothetical protein
VEIPQSKLSLEFPGGLQLEVLRGHLRAFGRDPAKLGLEGWLRMQEAKPDLWGAAAEDGANSVRKSSCSTRSSA